MEQDDLQSLSSETNITVDQSAKNQQNKRKSKRLNHSSNTDSKLATLEWKLGDYCESCDHTKSWYRCKIIQVEDNRVKVHFCGWNSRYDKWLEKNSNEIRPEKKSPKIKTSTTKEQTAAKKHDVLPCGTEVMAKWIDETYYPAKITRFLTKNQLPYYEVKFYDGIRKTVRFNNLRMAENKELNLFEEKKAEESKAEKSEEVCKRRAEAELLLAIQEPVVMANEEEKPEIDKQNVELNNKSENKPSIIKVNEEENPARKSLRVKRLRTFTEEIVFDSPSSSIAYNLASMRKEKSPEPTQIKEEKKPAKKLRKKLINSIEPSDNHENDEEKRRRKKSKKDKRKLFEELIRNSKIQLEKQQKLIAKQLEEHSLKKSQKKLQKMIKKHQKLINSEARIDDSVDLLPIECTVENCTKTFRKQSLLDYHLKYHHYVNSDQSVKTNQIKKNSKQKKKKKVDNDDYSYGSGLKSDDEIDPYEVIHCKCSNNINKGFMIQCEICLCWQHGDCENIRSNKQVPDNYLCWICSEPANDLKNLKYQSWIKARIESERLRDAQADCQELNRLKMLNECSKQYYGLNLLMYTLEFQMSLFNQLVNRNKSSFEPFEQSVDANNDVDYDDETYDQLNRLSNNITHLQDCIVKQFNDFDSKVEGNL